MFDLRLTLFGSPKLERDGLPLHLDTRKSMALLVYLVMSGQEQSREALAALFWPEQNEGRARASLRRALSSVRQTLGADALLTSRTHAAMRDGQGLYVDALAYRELTEPCCGQAEIVDNLAPCIEPLTRAVALYGSDFLAGFTLPDCPQFDEWHFFEAESLRRSLASALQTLSRWHTAQQEYEPAIDFARRRLALDRLHEPAQRRLMELYALSGQQAAAVRQYAECVRVLDEELGVPPEEETEALFEAIRSRRFASPLDAQRKEDMEDATGAQDLERPPLAPSPVATGDTPHNLPAQPTPFVGRERELSDILRRLQDPDCRLLTLVGPGGIGKTRLAIESAQHLLYSSSIEDGFAHGIFFVPMQPVSAESGIVSAIAEATNFHFYSDVPPREQLLNYLSRRRMLLLLDNFEHLLASADLVAEILASAPDVKILATSREGLKLSQEWFHPVTGMRFSREPAAVEQAVLDYDAVHLFAQNARRAQPGFPLMQEQDHIVRICRLVEGMPLGIELAAAWLKVLPCAQIADEIERGLDILTARHQDVPERHRSMRVLLEQSWRLLSEDEQDVLKRLSVFQGGFRRGAAAEIAGASLLTLATLVEKSLLQATQSGRYQMHELLRQFTREKLAENRQEESAALTQHSAYYLGYVAARQEMLNGPELQTALEEIDSETDNIRTAWDWASEQDSWESIEQALDGLYSFYAIRSRYQEGEELFANTIAHLEQMDSGDRQTRFSRLYEKIQARRGALCFSMGDFDKANSCLEISLSAGRDLGEEAFVRQWLGLVAFRRGNRAVAQAQLRRSLAISQGIDDLGNQAEALLGLCLLASSYGEFVEGKNLASASLAISRQFGRPDRVAQALSAFAWATNSLGGYRESEVYWRESLALRQKIGDRRGVAEALNQLGWTARVMGGPRLSDATTYYQEALFIFRDCGDLNSLANCLGDMALTLVDLGEYEQAIQFAREGFAIADEIGQFDLAPYNLLCMATALCGLRDFQASRHYLLETIKRSWDVQVLPFVVTALYYFADLLVAESALPELAAAVSAQKKVSALELLVLALEQPGWWQPFKDRAARLRAELESELPADIVTSATAHGQSRALEDAVAEILNAENGT